MKERPRAGKGQGAAGKARSNEHRQGRAAEATKKEEEAAVGGKPQAAAALPGVVSLEALYDARRTARGRSRSGRRSLGRRGGKRQRSRSRSRDRQRRRSRSQSSSGSRSPQPFRGATGASMDGSRAQRRAARYPGLTLKEGLAGMARYLPRCVGGVQLGSWDPRVVQYLTTVLDRGPKDVGMRSRRELRTLAEALDLLLEGDPLRAADVLMARFSSVELASAEQSWAVSQHLELVPGSVSGVASERAKHAASKEELLRQKLLTALGGKYGGRESSQRRLPPPQRDRE